jgi:transposase
MDQLRLTARQKRGLERQLHDARDARTYRRTLAVLEYSRGRPVAQIALMLSVTRQSVYNWIGAYAQRRDPSSLLDQTRSGRPRLLTEELEALLFAFLQTTPDQLGYFARSWTVPLLQTQMQEATGQRLSAETIRRALHRQQFVWKRPRYVLAPDPEREKKTLAHPQDKEARTRDRGAF